MQALAPSISGLTKRQQYAQLMHQMKSDRSSWEKPWLDIGDYIAPYDHEFDVNDTNSGRRRDSQIINETPMQARDVGVSGLFNGLCDPTELWLALETDNRDLNKLHRVRVWLEETRDAVLAEFAADGFYSVVPEDFGAILAFGTCASLTLESFDGAGVMWHGACPIGSYWISNNARRKVDQVARELSMSARQMQQEFPAENLSRQVISCLKSNNHEQRFSVTHIVKPNPMARRGLMSADKAFISCYYETNCADGDDKMLLEEGFDSNPFQVARWKTRGNDPWGFGPGHYAIGSSKSLQAYEIDIALAREKQINPPLIVPPGTNLAGLSLLPGALNVSLDAAGGQGLRPLHETRFDIGAGQEAINELEGRIRDAFYNNIFLMIANDDGGKMTAREVMERAREKRLALTPILRLTNEYLTPKVARALEIMGKRGKLPPYPPELEGQKIRVQYKSVLAQAAMMETSANMRSHMLNLVMPLAQMRPDVLDNYDLDDFLRKDAENSSVPASGLRSPEDVQAKREADAEEQAKAIQAEKANLAANTAKTLSETNTQDQNGLTDLLAATNPQ